MTDQLWAANGRALESIVNQTMNCSAKVSAKNPQRVWIIKTKKQLRRLARRFEQLSANQSPKALLIEPLNGSKR